MRVPEPRPGLVIRYAFLWRHEADRGAEEASKDRPCVIVAARRTERGDIRVVVAPITHEPPSNPDASIDLPSEVCQQLGLDGDRHWLRLDELNRFVWPGFDLRPVPRHSERCEYGMLPPGLFERFRERLLARQRLRASSPPVSRD